MHTPSDTPGQRQTQGARNLPSSLTHGLTASAPCCRSGGSAKLPPYNWGAALHPALAPPAPCAEPPSASAGSAGAPSSRRSRYATCTSFVSGMTQRSYSSATRSGSTLYEGGPAPSPPPRAAAGCGSHPYSAALCRTRSTTCRAAPSEYEA